MLATEARILWAEESAQGRRSGQARQIVGAADEWAEATTLSPGLGACESPIGTVEGRGIVEGLCG